VEHVLGEGLEPRPEAGERQQLPGSSLNRFGGGASSSGFIAWRTLFMSWLNRS